MFKKSVYIERRNKLKKLVNSGIILIPGNNESPMNYPANGYHFRQDSNFLYFFGQDIPGMAGVIDVDNDTEYIFADDVDIDDIIWMGPQPTVKALASEVGVENSRKFGDLADFLKSAKAKKRTIHFPPLYRNDHMIYFNNVLGIPFNGMNKYASEALIKAIVELRSIKDQYEIAELDKACDIGYMMHTEAMRMAQSGVGEREVAGRMEGISLSHGGVPSFPIILSVNGQTLHNHYHGNVMQEGNLMLADAGCETTMHYPSDHTRTTPVGGKFTQKQKEIYQIVLDSNNYAAEIMKPGVTNLWVHMKAAEVLVKGLKDLGIMKGDPEEAVTTGAYALFQPHGLGHMIGLDVHDMEGLGENYVGYDEKTKRPEIFGLAALRLGRELQPGFVLSNEPGCYFIPELIELWKRDKKHSAFINYDKLDDYVDFGGIRIEDDILITDKGSRLLGQKRIPVTPDEVEQTCQGMR
ncbi:MAG: aminopeptidase P family protein [Candidatus Delongbacteria bacterium]|jgi:Xaa-Pro aminopeptidase|nr:aminopeptidase P family protein [Candidatus Delongbacteria bacterium]